MYQDDQCNEAHPVYAKLKTFIIRHVAELEALPGTKMISAAKRILCMQNFKHSYFDTVAELEALPSTKMISAAKGPKGPHGPIVQRSLV